MQRFKFNLANAYKLVPVFEGQRVVRYKAKWNGLMAKKEEQLREQYNKLSLDAKSLGKYLAKYRDDPDNIIKGNVYYDQQITMLAGLKARKASTAKLLKKIKVMKRMEPSVNSIVKFLNSKDSGLPFNYDAKESLCNNVGNAIRMFNDRLTTFQPLIESQR